MFFPIPFKKLLAIFRGSVSPIFIFLSILLGFWFGMMPGFSGFHVFLIIVILILNVHFKLFLLSFALGKSLCFAAAPVLYHVGMWLQGNLAFVFKFLESVPIIGLTDFSTYAVAGGFVIGPIVGAIIGLLMVRSVISFRRMMLKFDEKSEKFSQWYSKTWVRILDRILIGKRTKDIKSMFPAKTKYIRKAGIALAILVIAITLVAGHFLKDNKVKEYAANAMTKANGAEVDLESVGLSLLKGAVSASGIQVTDPENPANNQVSIGQISADASIYDLLLGKVVMEELKLSNVQFNQKRATPGKVVETKVKEEPEVFEPNEYEFNPANIAKLDKYFKDAKALKEKLQKLKQYLPSGKSEEGTAEVEQKQVPQEYLEYLTARATTAISPRIMAKLAILDKVQVPSELFGNSKIEMTNISDAPKAAGLPITLTMNSLETPATMDMTVDYSTETPKLIGEFSSLDLSKIQSGLSSDAGIVFNSGLVSGNLVGIATKENLDLSLDLDISGLEAKGQGKGVLGLGSETTTEALAVLKNLKTTIRIVGPVTEPRLIFDVDGLTKEFQDALVKAGKEKLAEEIDNKVGEQIDKQLGDKAPDEIKDALKGVGGLLNGLGQ